MSVEAEPARDYGVSPNMVLASCLSLSIVSGSFYSWSLLLPTLQATLGCARAPLSAVFSLATICFTCGTSFLGPWLLARLSASGVLVAIGTISAAGLFLASFVHAGGLFSSVGLLPRLALLAVGWGVGFGSMSGLAYAQNAKISTSPIFKGREGFATGLLVAGRAAAPTIATPLVQWALVAGGTTLALRVLGVYMGLALLPAALALRALRLDAPSAEARPTADTDDAATTNDAATGSTPNAPPPLPPPPPPALPEPPRRTVAVLWLSLLTGSSPGLLCHGHAAAMMALCGGGSDASLRALGVGGMALGSVVGRLGGGILIDQISARRCLVVLPMATAAIVGSPLLRPDSAALTFAALVGCGLTYGLNAVALPVLVSRLYGAVRMGGVYGRVFTAWGVGGLLAPWLAGRLFDVTGGYGAALLVAALSLLISGLSALLIPHGS